MIYDMNDGQIELFNKKKKKREEEEEVVVVVVGWAA